MGGTARPRWHQPFLLWGVLIMLFGLLLYLIGVLLVIPRYLLGLRGLLDPVAEFLVWYSGVPVMIGLALALTDILFLFRHKKPAGPVRFVPVQRRRVTVALTAYNDEASIGPVVTEFLEHPLVERVVVVSNNSSDRTAPRAHAAGVCVKYTGPAPEGAVSTPSTLPPDPGRARARPTVQPTPAPRIEPLPSSPNQGR